MRSKLLKVNYYSMSIVQPAMPELIVTIQTGASLLI